MFQEVWERLKRWDGAVRKRTARLYEIWRGREWIRRAGYYFALAALLGILGVASYAYRNRQAAAKARPTDPPRAAIALSTPAHTPQPTPEPMAWVWPLEGEIIGAWSPEEPVWSETLGQWQTHPALDIAGSPGEAVYACCDGTVEDAWSDRLWGNVIAIDHRDGYRSVYANLNTLKLVAPGDRVTAGQVISSVGRTADCEAEMPWHLHFEFSRDGEYRDYTEVLTGHSGG